MKNTNKTIKRKRLDSYLSDLLQPKLFKDYCPNGLQVEGSDDISKIVMGVTACQALIEQAIILKAQAIVVHHGYFWRGEEQPIIGMKQQRIKQLISNNINLFAYHLPLDCHPVVGNNAQLGQMLGFPVHGWLQGDGVTGLGLWGQLEQSISGKQVQQRLQQVLQRDVVHVAPDNRPIRRIGWCTGGAQNYIDKAIVHGLDAYISGEISESTVHIARESGVHYFAAGHHATERGGVQALAHYLHENLSLDCEFVDIDSPA